MKEWKKDTNKKIFFFYLCRKNIYSKALKIIIKKISLKIFKRRKLFNERGLANI